MPTNPFHLDELPLPVALPEWESLPSQNNVERVERRLFETHAYWRHTLTLTAAGFFVLLALQTIAALWLPGAFQSTHLALRPVLAVVPVAVVIGLVATLRWLGLTERSLRRADRTINSLEEEVQRITSSRSYTLNKEVMPFELYLRTLALLRGTVVALVALWIALPTGLVLLSSSQTPTKGASTTTRPVQEKR